jgi:hypothetical protein
MTDKGHQVRKFPESFAKIGREEGDIPLTRKNSS